ncbi:helix-turn-helix domain containing protein [Haemophilus sputorum]|uniref:helix-turn-helix domain containing protein n=1 Tax=Haemophilus sputorum TaxID=1078480 RepID=UPI001E471252|nr:helix-turn-helix domain containing protein [Haemophilus sputorum]
MFIKWKYTKMVENFENQLKRAKECLGVKSDAAFAKAIEMPVTTFSSRKKEQKFPEKELFALKAKCPELNLDMDYILLGHRRETYEAIEQEMLKDMPKPDEPRFDPNREMENLMPAENLLLQYFRTAGKEGKEMILNVAKMAAKANTTQGNFATKMHIGNVEQQNNIEHLEGGIHFKKGK